MSFIDEWDFEMAMQVLQSSSVDSKTWADAVRWLMIFGPPEIKDLLAQASSLATSETFPELTAIGYSDDGHSLYDTKALAESLGVSEEDLMNKMAELEKKLGVKNIYLPDESRKIH
jgi:hypothetical protein